MRQIWNHASWCGKDTAIYWTNKNREKYLRILREGSFFEGWWDFRDFLAIAHLSPRQSPQPLSHLYIPEGCTRLAAPWSDYLASKRRTQVELRSKVICRAAWRNLLQCLIRPCRSGNGALAGGKAHSACWNNIWVQRTLPRRISEEMLTSIFPFSDLSAGLLLTSRSPKAPL